MTFTAPRLASVITGFCCATVICVNAVSAQDAAAGSKLPAAVPTLEMAMAAPPADLARSYMTATWGLRLVQLARANETIVTPEGRIDKNSAADWQSLFAARQEIYRQAIQKRGVISFAGSYRFWSASASCATAGSTFAAIIADERFSRRMIISQSGPELLLKWADVQLIGHQEAWAVENSFAFSDPMNSDYAHIGELNGDQLTIRPQPDVLNSWPSFERAPKEGDIRSCVITLVREKS